MYQAEKGKTRVTFYQAPLLYSICQVLCENLGWVQGLDEILFVLNR